MNRRNFLMTLSSIPLIGIIPEFKQIGHPIFGKIKYTKLNYTKGVVSIIVHLEKAIVRYECHIQMYSLRDLSNFYSLVRSNNFIEQIYYDTKNDINEWTYFKDKIVVGDNIFRLCLITIL